MDCIVAMKRKYNISASDVAEVTSLAKRIKLHAGESQDLLSKVEDVFQATDSIQCLYDELGTVPATVPATARVPD